ncbi:MAG TPA: PAS domain S-box protein [Proteobacteria bacterium]|nr:PAS domain S-box protein [Pseudomonadota bacterium]
MNEANLNSAGASETSAGLKKEVEELRKQLAESRALLEKFRGGSDQCVKIINEVKDGIFIETVRGEILDVNDAGCRMLGYSREELLSMDVGTLVPPQVAAQLPETIQEETIREGVYIETINVRKDGTHIPVEVSNTLIEIGGEKRVVAILHDISERVESREKLLAVYEDMEKEVRDRTEELTRSNEKLKREIIERKRAEEKLREEHQLFIGGPTVVFKWRAEPGWPVEYVSLNVESQFGYRPDDFISGRILYESIIHPDDLPRIAQEVKKYSETGKVFFEQTYRIAHVQGNYCWVNDRTVISRNSDGKIDHYYGYLFDITERKINEDELKKHRDHLEELVQKRTLELNAMVDAMARRVVRMSDLEVLVEALNNQILSAGLKPVSDRESSSTSPE